jgi:hypothetical protein
MQKEIKLSKFQTEFIKRRDEPLLVLATGISAGKSKVAGLWCVLETIQTKCRIIAAAQNFKALDEVLFREIRYWLNYFDIKYRCSDKKFTLENGSEIFGATDENPEGILGFTDISAAIIDEAAYCHEELYHYIGDRMRGQGIKPKYRLISSPSNQQKSKWFTDLCMKNPSAVIHATALDNPFTSAEFKESLKRRYGEGSALYRQQVLGEFIEADSSDALITIDKFASSATLDAGSYYTIGCDAARFGVDRTVVILRNNARIVDMIIMHKSDTFEICSAINKLAVGKNIKGIFVDGTGGYGAGVVDQLKLTYGFKVHEVNFGAKPKDGICSNNRAFMYRNLRDAILNGFYIENPEIREEICAQRQKLNGTGLFQLVPKEEIKEYLGRSPDLSDALALSFMEDYDDGSIVVTPVLQQSYINTLFR